MKNKHSTLGAYMRRMHIAQMDKAIKMYIERKTNQNAKEHIYKGQQP